MKSLEELSEFQNAKADMIERRSKIGTQLKERIAVAEKVSELIADPRFEVWGRHIEAMRDHHAKKSQAAKDKLTGGLLLGDEYLHVKMDQVAADAAMLALNNALKLAASLIKQGEEAMSDLKTLNS